MIEPSEKIWMDGKLVPWDEAKIHVLTHSLHYGSGVFEGIRAYETRKGPAVFRLTDHIARLYRSAKIYTIEIPYTPEELIEATKETVRASGLPACYIRPLVYLGYGEMGLNPLLSPVNVSIAVWPWGAYLGDEGVTHGVRMKISSWRRHDPNIIPPAAKGTGQYINSQLAKVEEYFGKNLHRMEYPEYQAEGWQIGSGVVESACKTVVGQRLKGAGMRWGEAGAHALCHVRALYRSEKGQWKDFWERRYTKQASVQQIK